MKTYICDNKNDNIKIMKRSKNWFIKVCVPTIYIVILVTLLFDAEREMKEKREKSKISGMIFPKVGKNRNTW